jgi:hypothetical protein
LTGAEIEEERMRIHGTGLRKGDFAVCSPQSFPPGAARVKRGWR